MGLIRGGRSFIVKWRRRVVGETVYKLEGVYCYGITTGGDNRMQPVLRCHKTVCIFSMPMAFRCVSFVNTSA